MNLYKEGIGSLCRVEQDLATGTDKDGEPIDDPLKVMMASIFDRKVRSVEYCIASGDHIRILVKSIPHFL